MGEENKIYASGNKSIITNIAGFNVMPLICYDLRFPVFSRNVNLSYDILIYVANWPAARHDAYISLLKARAIENQCYVVAVNRIGVDGNNIKYAGDSLIFSPKGTLLTTLSAEEGITSYALSLSELRSFREKFPVHLDADAFEII
jgi:predicted amidohydrolase